MGYKISPFLNRMTTWVLGLVLSVQLGISSLAQGEFTLEQKTEVEEYLKPCLAVHQYLPDELSNFVLEYYHSSECDFDFETLLEFKKSKNPEYRKLAIHFFNQKMQKVDQMLKEMGWIKLPPDSQIEAFLESLPTLRALQAKNPSNKIILYPPLPPEESQQMIAAKGVTQELWVEVMGSNPSHFKTRKYYFEDLQYFQKKQEKEKGARFMKPNETRMIITKDGLRRVQLNPDLPVEWVRWVSIKMISSDENEEQKKNSVAEFLERLNVVFDEAKRPDFFGLPKEKQWEWAARGGTVSKYVTGDDEMDTEDALARLAKYATWNKNSHHNLSGNPLPSGGRQTHPVDEREPNFFGFYRNSISEWTEDLYTERDSYRVYRGGGWNDDTKFFNSSECNGDSPSYYTSFLSFRLVRTTGP